MGKTGIIVETMEENENKEKGFLARNLCVTNELGLHARPAAKLAQEAQKFAARVTLVSGEQEVDAKSILDILTLAISQGSDVELRAEGEDADAAIQHIEELFRSKFQ